MGQGGKEEKKEAEKTKSGVGAPQRYLGTTGTKTARGHPFSPLFCWVMEAGAMAQVRWLR